MVDLKKLLEQVRTEREIAEKERAKGGKAPHPSNAFRVGSVGWLKAKRAALRKDRELEDKDMERAINRSLTQAKYYEKNKKRLNHLRIKRLRKPYPTFQRSKRRAERRGQEWDMTMDEWWSVWQSAPEVWNPDKAIWDVAWNLRGGNHTTDCQMVRIDPEKGWTKDNVRINIPASMDSRVVIK